MSQDKKIMLDAFQKHLLLDYQEYCKKHDVEETIAAFITYAIDENLFSSRVVRRYTVLKEFENLYPVSGKRKTAIVNGLADRFHISERSIWTMLKSNA